LASNGYVTLGHPCQRVSERENKVKKEKERMKLAKIKRKKQHDMYLGYGEILRLLSVR